MAHRPESSSSRFNLALVAIAAALLGTEGLLRQPLLDDMSVTSIVLAEHLVLALFAVPIMIAHRVHLMRLSRQGWLILFVIGWGASGGAALLFTKALDSGNATTASLLQNTQPLFVVVLAMILLRERLSRWYWPCLIVSMSSAYLLSFGTMRPVWMLQRDEIATAGYALGAAMLWGSGTVLARFLLEDLSYVILTAARFLLALPFLAGVAVVEGDVSNAFMGIETEPVRIVTAALIPGLAAVLLFYRGLRGTKASYATLAEFMYPTAALIGNWVVLDTTITSTQAVGCLVLLLTIAFLAWLPTPIASAETVPVGSAVPAGQ